MGVMKQIADNVYGLGTKGHNFYLVRDGEELTMIDAGCSKEWKYVVAGVESLGLGVGAISGVIATHAHSDHFGLATTAIDNGIDVSVHKDEETRATGRYKGRFSAESRDLPMFRIHTLKNFLPMLFRGVTTLEFPDSVSTFTDGDILDLPGRPRAIHTPGHTEGHVMFHMGERGILFTGDGLATMDLLSAKRGPQPMNPVFDLNPEQAHASLNRVVDVEADLLLPGHGKPWRGSPRDAVAATKAAS